MKLNIKRSVCPICHTTSNYYNPVARCFECKKKFCFDHIYAGQIKNGMKENEPVRDICEKCRIEKRYSTLEDAVFTINRTNRIVLSAKNDVSAVPH